MEYNFKTSEAVQEAEFCCGFSLVTDLLETLEHTREYESLELYANADLITEITRILLNTTVNDEPFTFGMFNIDGEGNDYFGEYVLTINDDLQLWCEPAFRDGELFNSDAFIAFVDGNCNSKILQNLNKQKSRVMIFDITSGCE